MQNENINFSASPITNKKYTIPTKLNDKQNLDLFIEENAQKKIVVVQGLGFVGAVMSIVCANSFKDEYAVIGVDLPNKENFWKIKSLNDGIFPLSVEDKKIDLFFENSIKKGNFYATYDPYAYSLADTIIVDVNLDVQKNVKEDNLLDSFDLDLTPFKRAISSIGENCKEDVLVLVETTVPPGTCSEVVTPILKTKLSDRGLKDSKVKIGHSYERVMPGPDYIDSIQNFYRVFSGVDEKSIIATKKFLKTIINTDQYPLTMLNGTNATEMAKVLENSYRSMNIAFIVEWSRFAEESGVNLYEVVEAIKMRPTHSNMMFPGIGVGGYCLTKDPLMASWSRKNIFSSDPLTQSEVSVKINDQMPKFAFEFFVSRYKKSLEDKKVLFLGVSYRGNVGDTRSTPVSLIYDLFLSKNADIYLNDPLVPFWEEKNLKVETSIDLSLSKEIDVIVISTGHTLYKSKKFIENLIKKPRLTIFDTIGFLNKNQITLLEKKHKLLVLGRGDLK